MTEEECEEKTGMDYEFAYDLEIGDTVNVLLNNLNVPNNL